MAGVLAVMVLGSATTFAASTTSVTDNNSHQGSLRHIFVIMLENVSRSAVIGNPNAPFINQLASSYGQASQYFGVTHPSEPNYVGAISGSNWFINDDNPANRFDHTNLVDQLESNHVSWGAYMDAMPSPGYLGDQWPPNAGLYVSKHDPFVLFNDIRDNPARLSQVKPYGSLASDLASGRLANFVWISPDACNDMHGGVYVVVPGHPETPCPYPLSNASTDPAQVKLVSQGDAFVKQAVTDIMASRVWREGQAAIAVVADEGSFDSSGGSKQNDGWQSTAGCCDSPILPPGYRFLGSNGQPDGNVWPGGSYGGDVVPAIVVTSSGPRAFTTDQPFNHYSLLRTVEENWNLGYLENASDAAQVHAMNSLFYGSP
ncbi:MAG TPA: alkaline phosphatase family protein [Candidatus Dormibacteraeota bacterium]